MIQPAEPFIIEPGRSARSYWSDLWRYRELMLFLAWRDIAVRYKQTVIGVAWAVIRPTLTMLVFVAFRRMVGMESSSKVPDAVLVFAAVLPWQLFSTVIVESSASLIGNANLVSKVYFPRLIIPSAAAVTGLVDFLITCGLLALLMAWYGVAPTWHLLYLPLFTALALALALGLGIFFAALNVEYRDFRYVVPFIVQFGLFVSPIAFSSANVPEHWRALLALNPMTGVIEGFRWSILGAAEPLDKMTLAASALLSVGALALGILHFRRVERKFADVI